MLYKDGPKAEVSSFLEQYRLSWLYAPDEVVRILNALVEGLKIDPAEGQMTEEQKLRLRKDRDSRGARNLALLVAAIRVDLFETADKKTKLTANEFGHYS